jgi:hypothetical protein
LLYSSKRNFNDWLLALIKQKMVYKKIMKDS